MYFEIDTLGKIEEHGTPEAYIEKTVLTLKNLSESFLKGFGKYIEKIKKKRERKKEEKKEYQEEKQTVLTEETEKFVWIVYTKDGSSETLRKKVKLPPFSRNIEIEGPGYFKNKSGKEVWGVKLSYESKVKRNGSEKWLKRTRIIPFSTDVNKANIQK